MHFTSFLALNPRCVRLSVCVAVVAIAFDSAGCQRGRPLPQSVGLSGAVTQNGKPVAQGQLTLYPLDKPGGASVGADIADGRHSAPVVPKGKYRVVLSATTAQRQITSSGDAATPPNGPPPPIDTLPQTIVEVSTPSSQFDIELKKP